MTQTSSGVIDVAAILARMAEDQRREAVLLAENKATLFDRLATTEVGRIRVEFDGGGDSGQIESIDAQSRDGVSIDLPDDTVSLLRSDGPADPPCHEAQSLRNAVETLAYACLYQSHAGWENNDGGFWTFSFDVAERTILLEMNTRISDVESSEHLF